MRPLSLAARLTLFFAIAAAVVFPVFGWVIGRAMERHFEEGDTAELEMIADAVYSVLAGARTLADLSPFERRFGDILIGHHSATLYIADAAGQPVYVSGTHPDLAAVARDASLEAGQDAPPAAGDSVRLLEHAGASYRVLVRGLGVGSTALADIRSIVVATPNEHHLTFLASFRRTLWLMIASAIAVMSLMGWIAVRRGHAPLREIAERMHRVTDSASERGIEPGSVPRELGELAVSFNAMLGRVDDALLRLENFNADIAHELRTPITNLMTQSQVALSRARTVDEYREVLYSNIEEYERMAQMVGDMLFLAQADRGAAGRESAEVDLAAEIRGLFDYYEGWAEERGVALELEGGARIAGDRRLLQRALSNLLSNAIRHTPRGGTVRVDLEQAADGAATVSVGNPGTPIPSEALPKLFDRFFRVDPSRQRRGEGAGLGLAIVKSIVELHGGDIGVVSNESGTRFTLSLPATA